VGSTASLYPLSTDKSTAELAELVVFLDGRSETAGILEFAGALAQEHGAQLIAVFMQPEPAVAPPETFARGTGILEVIEAHRAQLERIETDDRAQFEDIVRRHRIRSEWRSLPHLSSEGGCACVLRGPGGRCSPRSCGADGRPSWPRGVPRPDLRPTDHHVPARQQGIPGASHPGGLELCRGFDLYAMLEVVPIHR
jgi:hypothetical protein